MSEQEQMTIFEYQKALIAAKEEIKRMHGKLVPKV